MAKAKKNKGKFAGMTPTERARAIGRLGGLARAKNLDAETRRKISAKGGIVCKLRYGDEYFRNLVKTRWDGLSEEAKEKERQRLRKLAQTVLAAKRRDARIKEVNERRRKSS